MNALKHFVLDTNVLLHNPDAITSFGKNYVVLPMTVIEELDSFKRNNDELGRNARHVIRQLDRLRTKGTLKNGVIMDNGGIIKITVEERTFKNAYMDMSVPDNRILAIAKILQDQNEHVIFVSKDINSRLKADALGLEVMDFEKEKYDFDTLYTGYQEINVPGELIDALYQREGTEIENYDFLTNEFVLLKDLNNPKHSGLGRAVGEKKVLPLQANGKKVWKISPRSKEQQMAFELLLDPEVNLVTLIGRAGTGKTFLALAAGLEMVIHQERYEKLLVSRPIIPMGKDIGYLPGSKDDKLSYWMQPIFDNLIYLMGINHRIEEGTVQGKVDELIKDQTLELEALTYIRGRSIPNQFVIIDEAQNLTPHEVKTIISRAGESTKMVFTGDPNQIDNPYLDAESNGLSYIIERLKGQPLFGHVTLTKSERSPLSDIAAQLL